MNNFSKMSKGFSLHIGVNQLDPGHYRGWDRKLSFAEDDSSDMSRITRTMGFEQHVLLGEQATRGAVRRLLQQGAKKLGTGDFFALTFSGFSGFVPAYSKKIGKVNRSTWCLFDAQLLFEELASLLSVFRKGVRVLVFSDCAAYNPFQHYNWNDTMQLKNQVKLLPEDVCQRVYLENKDFYDSIFLANRQLTDIEYEATIQWMHGCQDNQLAFEGAFNGLFTATLKSVWNGGSFDSDYDLFFQQILWRMPAYQTPKLTRFGSDNRTFFRQLPFQI